MQSLVNNIHGSAFFKFIMILKTMVLSYLVGIGAFVGTEYIHLQYFERAEAYVYYESVEPTKETYVIGEEKLQFISTSEVKQPVQLSWEDTLYCDDDGNGSFGYEAQYNSKKYYDKPTVFGPKEPRTFPKKLTPTQETCCILHSTTFAELNFGVKHPHPSIISGPFCFIGSSQE